MLTPELRDPPNLDSPAPRKTRRGAKAPEDAEFVYTAKGPAKKKVEKPEKPAHIPGSGPALKRGLPKKNR